MEINETIRHFRTLKGYSVNKLANRAGISQSYLRDIELGKKNPTIEILSYICEALNISLVDFFDYHCNGDSSLHSLSMEILSLSTYQRKLLEAFLHSIRTNEKSNMDIPDSEE